MKSTKRLSGTEATLSNKAFLTVQSKQVHLLKYLGKLLVLVGKSNCSYTFRCTVGSCRIFYPKLANILTSMGLKVSNTVHIYHRGRGR